MSSLDDLRTTLGRHADDLDDPERSARPVAVRARIRTVRRRRAAGGAAAVVLVLVAGVLGAGLLRSPSGLQPADTIVGVDVPSRIEVLEFPYELREVTELTDDSVSVDAAARDQAVVLAASGLGDGSATLYADGEPIGRVRGDEETAAPVTLGDAEARLTVRLVGTGADARAGVAVYEATGELAPGVDNGTVVFRDQYAGQPLLGAAFAAPGESSVEFQTAGADAMRFALYCDGPDDLFVNVDIDGEPGVGTSCGAHGPDAAAGTSATLDDLGRGTHEVRVYLTRDGADETAVEVDGVVVGAGVYADGETVEYAGRTWVPDGVLRPGAGPVSVDTADGDRLLGATGQGELGLTWQGGLADGGSDGFVGGEGPGSMLAGVLLAGDVYRVSASDPDTRVLVYRPE